MPTMPLHYNPSHDSAYTSSSPPNLDKLGGRWQTSLEGMCIYPLSCPDVRVQLMMVMSKNTAYAKNVNRLPSLSIPIVEVCSPPPPVLFFYIPISVPGLYPHYAGVILSLPPLRYFPSIAYCVPRHERVELVYLHRLFWSLTVGGTDGLFFPFSF